jgi:hypothetical protein
MPFGKKVLTPKAHTKGVGDEQHIQGALDFLVRSRLMSLPEDDSPATREQRQAGFVEAEEFFKRLEWMQPCNSQVFRYRFALRLPACVRAHLRTRQHARAPGKPGHLTVQPPVEVQAGGTISFTHAAACVGRCNSRSGPGGQ